MRNAITRLICFMLGHDLQLYQLTYRNQTRLVCRHRQRSLADTFRDLWLRLRRPGANTLRGNPEELPF